MTRLFKDTVKGLFKAFNYDIVHAPAGEVTGVDLVGDLRCLVKNDSPLCFDVGANLGQTIGLLQQTFKDPLIHSFEPATETFRRLQEKNYGPRVVLHNFALGSKNSQQEFINYDRPDLSRLLKN